MKPHEEWLFKALQDLESSKVLLRAEHPLLDIAVYHTQQCGEKSLKAFLAYRFQTIGKTHNLMVLLESCREKEACFVDLMEDCIFLNPFATLYRYPEGELLPKQKEVIRGIDCAERIYDFVRRMIK